VDAFALPAREAGREKNHSHERDAQHAGRRTVIHRSSIVDYGGEDNGQFRLALPGTCPVRMSREKCANILLAAQFSSCVRLLEVFNGAISPMRYTLAINP
jgi:hypothetical protein